MVRVHLQDLGYPEMFTLKIRDLWLHKDMPVATVTPHGVVMITLNM